MENKFLYQLLETPSVSGLEEAIQEIVVEHMEDVAERIDRDAISDVICVMNPDSPRKIMLSAHVDEIGLVISNITEDGMLQVVARGGISSSVYPGHSVCVKNEKGLVYGCVQSTKELLKKKELVASELLIDIGAVSEEDALASVSLGDCIVQDTQVRELKNGRISARGLDDRIGVYIIMEAFRRAKEKACSLGVYAASTVGEETTKNGAYWTAERIEPDLAIVVDVTYTSDYAGMQEGEAGRVHLGAGPVLCNVPLVPRYLNEEMEQCAKRRGITLQREAASGLTYTDGDKIHFSGKGVPTVLVSVPLRYMHMPSEVADLKDVEACIELIAEFLISTGK